MPSDKQRMNACLGNYKTVLSFKFALALRSHCFTLVQLAEHLAKRGQASQPKQAGASSLSRPSIQPKQAEHLA